MILEIIFILIFLLLNGFFSASEIAVVTSRKSYVKNLAEKGSYRANKLLKLQAEPDRLLATVQIGVTVMGALSGLARGQRPAPARRPVWPRPR